MSIYPLQLLVKFHYSSVRTFIIMSFMFACGYILFSLLRWEEFCRDVSLEKTGYYIQLSRQKNLEADGVVGEDNICESLGLKSWTLSPCSSSVALRWSQRMMAR